MSAALRSKGSGNFVAGIFLTAISVPRAVGLSDRRRATRNNVPSGFVLAIAAGSSIFPVIEPPGPAAGAAASGAAGGGGGGGGVGGVGAAGGALGPCASGGTAEGAPASSFFVQATIDANAVAKTRTRDPERGMP